MRRLTLSLLILLATASAASALEPSGILMIVNGNAPTSRKWAELYANERQVPIGNLVALDLPAQEEMPRDKYVENVAKPVRAWLEKNDPQHKIKCLLTFTGVPIRVSGRPTSPAQQQELKKIVAEEKAIQPQIAPRVKDIEAIVKHLDPAYKPPTELTVMPALTIRVDHAVDHLLKRLNNEPSAEIRRAALERLLQDMEILTGPSGRLQRVMFKDLPVTATQPTSAPATGPAEATTTLPPEAKPAPTSEPAESATQISPQRRELLLATQARMSKTAVEVQALSSKQDDPESREKLRTLVRDELGLMGLDRLLTMQDSLINPADTGAALDSELSLVLWGDDYPLYRWVDNPLYFRNARKMAGTKPVMMVMRLDGPDEDVIRNIIAGSIEAERVGLGGKVVIDSRGLLPQQNGDMSVSYGEYDQTLRDLATLLKEKTSLTVVFDDHPAVLRAGSAKDVGLYVGWYALRNYTASCSFRPGAVGFHVASWEMISLKSAGERGWVVGLLKDGIAATLGAVSEPYLNAFPKADEFFPLLLTGKLTLAEVYWRTNPLASWQISMIGDPLYTPFKVNPQLKELDLPGDLRAALHTKN